tara:strand:+ start:833 stop:970 length:138 start_codon:yes stop_codon:yes gene_type:complete
MHRHLGRQEPPAPPEREPERELPLPERELPLPGRAALLLLCQCRR